MKKSTKKSPKAKKCKDGKHTMANKGWDACIQCGYGEGDCEKCGTYCDNEGNEM